jgi:hypothetical protein
MLRPFSFRTSIKAGVSAGLRRREHDRLQRHADKACVIAHVARPRLS